MRPRKSDVNPPVLTFIRVDERIVDGNYARAPPDAEDCMPEKVIRPPNHPAINAYEVALNYAKDVLTGKIIAGKLVKLAAKRFISDLKYGHLRGLKFDAEAAQHVVDFFGFLHHSKGEWGGQTFVLAPWQTFILANLFGWKRADGTRRFREAHLEVARKNGKTTFLAGIGLYLLLADDEPGAEVYSAATKKDQAKILFDEAVRMRKSSAFLAGRIAASRNNLAVLASHSKFEPLSAEDDTLDGLNSHGLLIDELHAHPTRKLFDVLHESTAARRNPLTVSITTAGYNTDGICYKQREIAEKILVGLIEAAKGDHVFAFIACIDEGDVKNGIPGDRWNDEACWPKANPSLGVSVKIDKLREAAMKAENDPSALNSFLRKHLNVWTSQDVRWMPPDKWAACNSAGPLGKPVELRAAAITKLLGRSCIGALDLSENVDLSAFILLFPPTKKIVDRIARPQTREQQFRREPVVYDEVVMQEEDPKWSVLCWFWVPNDNIDERTQKDRVHYDVWKREKFLQDMPGKSNNHERIRDTILALRQQYKIEAIGYDGWYAQWISAKLVEDGMKMHEVRMGFKTMSEPMKQLMAMVLEKRLEHYGDPVLAWNASNVAADMDAAGGIKPDKEKSKEKIDGVVSLIMAMAVVCAQPALAQPGGSVYSERGIIFL